MWDDDKDHDEDQRGQLHVPSVGFPVFCRHCPGDDAIDLTEIFSGRPVDPAGPVTVSFCHPKALQVRVQKLRIVRMIDCDGHFLQQALRVNRVTVQSVQEVFGVICECFQLSPFEAFGKTLLKRAVFPVSFPVRHRCGELGAEFFWVDRRQCAHKSSVLVANLARKFAVIKKEVQRPSWLKFRPRLRTSPLNADPL